MKRVLLAALSAVILAGPARAQSVDAALDATGRNIAAAVNRQGYAAGTQVGVANFVGSAGVACEPMASFLISELRRKLIDAAHWMGAQVNVVENLDPGTVKAVVSAKWLPEDAGKVRLTLTLGDVTDMTFRDIMVDAVVFDAASLPPTARRCVLKLDPVEVEVVADRALIARDSPNSTGAVIGRIGLGDPVWVSGRVVSEGAEDWFVVRLPPDETMPVGMRERRAFVYNITLPKEVQYRFKVAEMDATYGTLRTARLRAEPLAWAAEVARVPAARPLRVTGKVMERNWLRVLWNGGHAYVFGDLVQALDPAEVADWEAADGKKDRDRLKRFIGAWPKGFFHDAAVAQLDALGPPPLEFRVWTEHKNYKKGEKIKIFLKGNKAFFAHVVYVDASGNCVTMLPNAYRVDTRFNGDTVYTIPDAADRFDLEVGEPFGNESIYVFGSTLPLGRATGTDVGAGLSLCPGTVAQTRGVVFTQRESQGREGERFEAKTALTTRP